MSDHDALPTIAASQRTPLVEQLLEQIEALLEDNRSQAEQIQQLRDEIARRKGQQAKPKLKPSGMDPKTAPDDDADGSDAAEGNGGTKRQRRQRPGSSKRSKTPPLTSHETTKVAPQVPVPDGARVKGYRDCIVPDLRIAPHHTR